MGKVSNSLAGTGKNSGKKGKKAQNTAICELFHKLLQKMLGSSPGFPVFAFPQNHALSRRPSFPSQLEGRIPQKTECPPQGASLRKNVVRHPVKWPV